MTQKNGFTLNKIEICVTLVGRRGASGADLSALAESTPTQLCTVVIAKFYLFPLLFYEALKFLVKQGDIRISDFQKP